MRGGDILIDKVKMKPAAIHYVYEQSSVWRIAICRIAVCLALMFSFSATSCELLIKVASSYQWPPYIFKSNGKLVGVEIEILDSILSKTPFCREFVEMPSSSRGFEELKNKRVDMLIGASFHPDRKLFSQFSTSYRYEKMVIFAQEKTSLHPSIIDNQEYLQQLNVKNNIIAINQGSVYGDNFNKFLGRYKGSIINTRLARQRFDLLKKDRIDYVVEDELTGIYLLAYKNYSNDIINTKMVVNFDSIYYMLRLELMSDAQLDVFNQAIKDSDLTIKQIIKKYSSSY